MANEVYRLQGKFHGKGGFSDQPIALIVRGHEQNEVKPIHIFPQLLFGHSPYFRRLLKVRNGQPNAIHYTDLSLDADAMESFACYCNRDTIDDFVGTESRGKSDVLPEMLNIWFLAEKLEATPLQNLALTTAARAIVRAKEPVSLRRNIVAEIYSKTRTGSVLRSYIVDLYAWCNDSEDPDLLDIETARNLPFEFIYDCFRKQSMKVGDRRVKHEDPNLNPAVYHLPVQQTVETDSETEREETGNGSEECAAATLIVIDD